MGRIFYVMGKSASGKDTIYKEILECPDLQLKKIILYTTRPIRKKEQNGSEYHFVSEEKLQELEDLGKVIELRAYETIHGIWQYATVDDGQINLERYNYLAIGTLVSYQKMKSYFGAKKIIPIYIEVLDVELLERALKREKKQVEPKYGELCRRFLADAQDFSEDNIQKANIQRRFSNNGDRQECMNEVISYLRAEFL